MATISTEIKRKKGISLLSLDAGGPRGISQLEILKHVMDRLNDNADGAITKRPCEVFAMIGGTGTGGLIAVFLAILKMTADEALETFTDVINKVFKDTSPNPTMQTEKLKKVVNEILAKHHVPLDTKLVPTNGAPPTCRLYIPVVDKKNTGSPIILTNYGDPRGPPVKLTIAEAMLATCASPPMFSPVEVTKDFGTVEYISADLGFCNPVRETIEGAHSAFGDETTVICVLSVGCGNLGANIAPGNSQANALITFLKRIALDGERKAQEVASQMEKLPLYHRLSVAYGIEISQDESWKDLEDISAHTRNYLIDEEVARTVNHCITTLKDGIGSTTLEQLKYLGGGEVLAPELLELTPNYVERKAPMEFLEKCLFDADGRIKGGSKRVIVTGMGGCGKTQLVRKLIENHGDLFVSVFFVDGSSNESIKRELTEHVRALGGAHSQKSFEECMKFLSLPTQGGERLLVIDNVDDPNLNISAFLPKWKRGAVIITSRNGSHGQLSPLSHLQLDVMSLNESIELLIRGSGGIQLSAQHSEAASKVAEELGYLPIALVQAASYIYRTECSADTYISLLRTSRQRVLSDPATSQIDMRYTTAFAAFDASYSILPSKARLALHLLSFFHRRRFPIDCIGFDAVNGFSSDIHYLDRGEEYERGRECLKEIFYSDGMWDPAELEYIISSLRSHSLIILMPTEITRLLQMHSLMRLYDC
ncbi:hypothetical protein M408DRAFT_29983 [Serendipita vermifera MAFF 305830]|uniref:PNPLA domain-containing protein n=1 Tax=Serendipita vermifera MAFF 305830 TaxID=933852 RepID=A0A0C3ANQ2_SERVB|nr:hypothetical protein M408DRAFT_29983 [Serendipita vermifera MAFF 305830]